jgi:pyruvate/2-oxoacid:ferredoxin oxidoreductase alpha subunit
VEFVLENLGVMSEFPTAWMNDTQYTVVHIGMGTSAIDALSDALHLAESRGYNVNVMPDDIITQFPTERTVEDADIIRWHYAAICVK